MQHGDHPRYFARVPGPSSFAGILGDWVGTGFNAIASSWAGGSGTATAELVVCDWIRAELGLPDGTEGVLTSGGSLANLTALIAARTARGSGVAYLSDQTHSSIARGLRAIGVDGPLLRLLPTDGDLRLAPATVAAAIAEDRAAGRAPTVVVASAGTTNTGTIDDLPALADLCAAEGLWLHVDGAYGGPAALCPAGRAALRGIERADSVVLDPHKWLFQPYDMGIVLVREPGALERAFSMTPEYLIDVTGRGGEVDLRDRSLELSRRARGLKLWLTLRTHGLDRIGAAIARGIELAEEAERLLRADARWEVVTPAQIGVVTFAVRDAPEGDHARRAAAVAADGYAAVTSTRVLGRSVLRLCTINPRTTSGDLAGTLQRLLDA